MSARFAVTCACLLVALVSAVAVAQDGAKAPSASGTGSLADRLEAIRAQHNVPALGAALVRDGKVMELAVTGVAAAGGEDQVAPDDAWHIGSDTKAMTATLVARLVEQGKLSWDMTLAEGIPDFAGEMEEIYKSVTLRQLLGHRGAIVGHEANATTLPALWGFEREDRPMRERRLSAARMILTTPTKGQVGAFNYSNCGYLLAGVICEKAADASWEDLMKREVFEPLGISSAGFGPPPRIRGHLKRGEEWQPHQRDNPQVMGPAGTVHMSLADWAKFAAAHMGNVDGYLKPETLAILHDPLPGAGASYAMGWGARKNGEGKVVQLSHAGSNTMWFALIVIDLDKGQARLAAANAVGDTAVQEAIRAMAPSAGGTAP
jgi:CubicO group peptidase (beta-lactamase class C family)